MRSIRSGLLVGAIGAVFIFSAPAVTSAGGDAAAGKTKAVACAVCHTAIGNSDTPHLVGQRETYIVKQMKAFHDQCGVGVVDLFFQQPSVDHREVMKEIELFGRAVLPHIKEF